MKTAGFLLGAVIFLTACGTGSRQAAARTEPAGAPQAMSMTNVYDAFGKTREGLTQDFGFSSLVEYEGMSILFDAGMDARVFERNVKTLGIELRDVDIAIVSHGHYDHVGGFDALIDANPSVRIYVPNDFFSLGAPTRFPFRETEPDVAATLPEHERYFGGARVVEGMVSVPTGRFWRSNVKYVTAPEEIAPGVMLVPTTSALMGTFIKYPPHGEERPQFIGLPELSVSFATPEGEVILAGCSHSTIETIVAETQKLRPGKIRLVAGGFHLIPYARESIEALATRMRDQYGVASVAPAHCTGHMGFTIFRAAFGEGYRFFGLGERLEF